jgi:gluconolactonase
MKLDIEGNIYCTGPGAVEVFDAHGKRLGIIKPTEPTANLAWGDADGKGLYMTALTGLYGLRLNIPGKR